MNVQFLINLTVKHLSEDYLVSNFESASKDNLDMFEPACCLQVAQPMLVVDLRKAHLPHLTKISRFELI